MAGANVREYKLNQSSYVMGSTRIGIWHLGLTKTR